MVNYSGYEFIRIEKQDGVALATLNRPEALNAANQRMHAELSTIFEDLRKDDQVKAVVLTGAGRAFCAGGDIRWMLEREHNPSSIKKAMAEDKKIVTDILDLEVPLIAAVNGPAIGLGATIALFCDVIIASERARFGDPHVRVGIVAGDGGAVIWPLLVGVAKAKELLMTGDALDAQQAERLGLVNRVVPEGDLMPAAMELARRLAKGPLLAISWTKMAVNRRIRRDVDLIMDTSLAWEEHTFYSEDHKEAARAFVEKREPRFQGR
jgi:enoyl-CoA hydratase